MINHGLFLWVLLGVVSTIASASSISDINRSYVEACHARIAPNASAAMSYNYSETCRRGLSFHAFHGFARYQLFNDEQAIHIQMRIRFGFGRYVALSRQQEIFGYLQSQCLPHIREVWNRYGIRFDLGIDASFSPHPGYIDHFMTIYDSGPSGSSLSERANAGTLYFGPPNIYTSATTGADLFCRTLLHETGHMMGLTDEYAEPACPRRFTRTHPGDHSMPQAIMEAMGGAWEDFEFYPDNLRNILRPLCGG